MNEVDNHKDLPEYAVAKKVWDDIHNNDTLIHNDFEEYFFHEFYKPIDMTNDELHEWARINLLPHENAETQLAFAEGREGYDEDYIREIYNTKNQ
jgi:hypothetical protein